MWVIQCYWVCNLWQIELGFDRCSLWNFCPALGIDHGNEQPRICGVFAACWSQIIQGSGGPGLFLLLGMLLIMKSWLKCIQLEIYVAFGCDFKWLLFFKLSSTRTQGDSEYVMTWRMTTWSWQVFLNLDGERLVLLRDGWQALWYAQQRDNAPNCGPNAFFA